MKEKNITDYYYTCIIFMVRNNIILLYVKFLQI